MRETEQLVKAVRDVASKAYALLGVVESWLKMSPKVVVPAEVPQGRDQGVCVPLPTADLEGRGEVPVRCRHVPTPPLDRTQDGEDTGEDFGIPKALRQVLRLLGVVFNERELVFRLLLEMGRC